MARQARKESSTGIFHVMMRGINHQNIFEELEDYYQFIATLDRMRVHYDEEGSPSGIENGKFAMRCGLSDLGIECGVYQRRERGDIQAGYVSACRTIRER